MNEDWQFKYGASIPQGDAFDKFKEIVEEVSYPSCRVGQYFENGRIVLDEPEKPVTVNIDLGKAFDKLKQRL